MPMFLKDMLERALSTFIQVFLVFMTAMPVFDVLEFSWGTALIAAGSAAVLTVVKSLAASMVKDPDSASLADLRQG